MLVVLYLSSHFCILWLSNRVSLRILYALHITPQHKDKTFNVSYLNVAYKSSDGEDIYQYKLAGYAGYFQSPNFPEFYPNHSHCFWDVNVPGECWINITFLVFSVSVNIALCWNKNQITETKYASKFRL